MGKTSLPQTEAEPQDVREYDRMLSRQRMLERAANLHRDGYSVFARTTRMNSGFTAAIRGEFVIVTPKGETYAVNPLEQTCTCVCWRRHGTCKHLKGLYVLACRQAWELIRHNALGSLRYAEGYMLLGAIEDCRRVAEARRQAAIVAEVVALRAAAERRQAA